MKFYAPFKLLPISCLCLITTLFVGCADDDNDVVATIEMSVEISNVTNGQPLTPVAVVIHKSGYTPWSIGSAASVGLEKLAESGDVTDFISEANADANVLTTGMAGSAPFAPGSSETVSLSFTENSDARLTLASMLANTNDAFAGNTQVKIGSMSVGDSMTLYSHVHDSGTEKNSEASGTLAGPADSSTAADKGFSATRDDSHDFVTIHPGVVSKDDGLSTSVLDESHRWNGPAAKVVVTRTK